MDICLCLLCLFIIILNGINKFRCIPFHFISFVHFAHCRSSPNLGQANRFNNSPISYSIHKQIPEHSIHSSIPNSTKMPSEKENSPFPQPFNENAPEYFPSTCCEFLHVQSALYLACFIQLAFVFTLSLLYLALEQSQFINAVDVFRPGVGFVVFINLTGILCALIGVCVQRDQLISIQITLLLGLVCLSDLLAFLLVATMAFGSKIGFGQFDAKYLIQSLLVNERRWESFLGPFWPYLLAILFHMSACAMICFLSVHRRYGQFLRHKYSVVDSTPTITLPPIGHPPQH